MSRGPDPQTLVIQWASPYPYADALVASQFPPLPAHLLAPALEAVRNGTTGADAFENLPFWRTDYVGAGPFRITRWEQGAFIEAQAFDGHALGRPHLDRLIVRVVPDGWYVEPGYDLLFHDGTQHGLGVSAGLLMGW